MQVEIRTLVDGKDHVAGVIRLQDSKLVPDPPDNRLRSILAEPLFDREAGEVVTVEDDPQRFLELLRFQYKSAYLRASAPKEDRDGLIR